MAPRSRSWRVYVLRCGDASLYTGITCDLAARVARHASGKGARYTRSRLPVQLVYEERAADRPAALRREAALKKLPRARKLALVSTWRPGRYNSSMASRSNDRLVPPRSRTGGSR